MRYRAYKKSITREILSSKARFASILVIILLGVAFYSGIKSSGPDMNKAVNELYKNQYDLAMDLADDDSDNAAQMIKDAAINYCKALADKGDSYLSAIKSVFGSLDYESVISELINDGDIFSVNSAIEEIMSKVLDIKESANVDDLEMNWSKDLGDFEMNTGCTRSFTIGDVRSSNNVDIDTSLIKYSATVTSGDATATVDGLGNITITSSDSVGVSSIEISVMYDGKVIGTKKINVTVAKNELSTGNSIFEELGYTEDNSGYLRTNKTDGLDLDNAKSQACGLVETEVQNIAKALEAAGYSSTLLAKAKDMTVAYFNAYINAVYADGVAEQKKRPNVTFEANGESYTQEFFYRSRIPDAGLGYRPDEADVQLTQQTCWGKRGMWISVSKNAIIEKFIEYYNQLI